MVVYFEIMNELLIQKKREKGQPLFPSKKKGYIVSPKRKWVSSPRKEREEVVRVWVCVPQEFADCVLAGCAVIWHK